MVVGVVEHLNALGGQPMIVFREEKWKGKLMPLHQ
jgi:hypothetical protein